MKRIVYVLLLALVLEACMGVKAQNNDFVTDALTANVGGWVEDAEDVVWTYVSANAAGNTFVISAAGDLTDVYYASLRFRAKQSAAYEHFIVHYVEYDGGADTTSLTLFGGASGTLSATTITDTAFSPVRFPVGFPRGEAEWSIEVSDANDRDQATPTSLTWYNLDSSHKIVIPVGDWDVYYSAVVGGANTSLAVSAYVTLSTANNSESDVNNTVTIYFVTGSATALTLAATVSKSMPISLTTETTYYLNAKENVAGMTNLGLYGTLQPTIIRVVSAYY
jgi:hypothetical protein